METKLITKTIKELADEYDGNVEQLHREIRKYNVEIKYLKNENDDLRRDIRLEQFARENAEDNAKISAITMIIFCAASAGLTVYNYLFV